MAGGTATDEKTAEAFQFNIFQPLPKKDGENLSPVRGTIFPVLTIEIPSISSPKADWISGRQDELLELISMMYPVLCNHYDAEKLLSGLELMEPWEVLHSFYKIITRIEQRSEMELWIFRNELCFITEQPSNFSSLEYESIFKFTRSNTKYRNAIYDCIRMLWTRDIAIGSTPQTQCSTEMIKEMDSDDPEDNDFTIKLLKESKQWVRDTRIFRKLPLKPLSYHLNRLKDDISPKGIEVYELVKVAIEIEKTNNCLSDFDQFKDKFEDGPPVELVEQYSIIHGESPFREHFSIELDEYWGNYGADNFIEKIPITKENVNGRIVSSKFPELLNSFFNQLWKIQS